MPRLKIRARFAILLIITLVGVSIYYASDIEQTTYINTQHQKKPNAFTSGTVLKEYDEHGKLQLKIESDKSYYFKADGYIETSHPRITFRNEQDEVMHLDASEGIYLLEKGLLTLKDAVQLTRTSTTGESTQLKTEDLNIDTENDFIYTDRKVSIKQANNTLSAQGIKASLNDRKIELKHTVRGSYELAN